MYDICWNQDIETTKNLSNCCIFLLDFERFSIQRFLIEDFKMLPFRQFLSYKNVPYIKMG